MKKLLSFPFFLLGLSALAQESAPIMTDRPTQSAASTVMAKGRTLIEYGFIYEKTSADLENITFANVLFRLGMINGVELRVTQNIQQANFSENETISGLSPTTIGTKIHLVSEQGAFPQTSLIGQVTLENGKEAFRPGRATPEVRLNFSNSLSENVSLGYNIGVGFPEDTHYTFYTAVLGYSFAPGWTLFAEPYGFFYENASDHRFNSGLIYLVSDHFQVDVSGGVGLSAISPNHFTGLGAAVGF